MKIRQVIPHIVWLSVCLLTLALCLPVFADDVPEALRPPKGSLLDQASRTYKIPLIQHDFPLPMHNWSLDAAILARYFDTHSKELGNEFRLDVFQHQFEILPNTLHGFAEKFASAHKVGLPFAIDPDGKLAALVKADKDLGTSLHVQHTPTIYIVSNKKGGKPYVEVTDTSQLYVMIDAMK
jgi:protein-disulfide isomerase